MDNESGAGSALEEAVIALRYKIFGEDKYGRFKKAMDDAEKGGVKSRRVDIKVSVDEGGLKKIKQLQRAMKDIATQVTAKVDIQTPTPRRARKASAQTFLTDDFVGPRKPVPISWPSKEKAEGGATPPPPRASRVDAAPKVTVTVDQIRELGSAAKAAAASIRNEARNLSSRLGVQQQRNAIDGAHRYLAGSRSRFDPYAADQNADRWHAAGNISALKFSRPAPEFSRYRFSPAIKNTKVPKPDMSMFMAGIKSLRSWSKRMAEKIQKDLEISPSIKKGKYVGGLRDAMATVGASALVGGFASVMNESQQLTDQIKNLTPGIEDATRAQKGLLEAAKQTNASYKGTVDIYSSLAAISDKTKLSTDQNVDLAKIIQMSSQLGGGTAEGQKRAIIQLEQALQMGKMDGQGINSIESQSRGLGVIMAEGMGKSLADLKQLTKEGKLTAQEITKAFLKMGPEVEKRFAKVGVTLGGLRNYAKTVMLEWAGKLSGNWNGWAKGMRLIRDAMVGLNDFMSGAFEKLKSVMGGGENAAKAVQSAFLSLGGGAVIAAVWAFGGAVLAALWPVVVAAGAVFTAILAIDDIMAWMSGRDSVMGELVGPFKDFKPVFDDISKSFGELGKAWNDLWGGDDGMKDALNQGQEPPLARSFRSMLASIKEIIENVKEMLRLLKALQDGNYGSALDIGGNVVKNGIVPGGDAHGMGWAETAKYALYGHNPREDPILGWWIKTADWMTGTKTLPIDQRKAQIDAARGMESRQITNNNSPNITVYAGSNDPSEIASKTATAVSNSLKQPMLPNVERGPR